MILFEGCTTRQVVGVVCLMVKGEWWLVEILKVWEDTRISVSWFSWFIITGVTNICMQSSQMARASWLNKVERLQDDALLSALLLRLQSCASGHLKHFSDAVFGFSTALQVAESVDLLSHCLA